MEFIRQSWNKQCAVYVSLMLELINGVKVGGSTVGQAINASNIKDANNKSMFDYYEYKHGNNNSYIPNYKWLFAKISFYF